MGNSISVQVLDGNDRVVEGAKVEVIVDGIFSGGSLVEYTDSSGHADFETADDYEDSRDISIYVRGESYGPYDIGGGSFTVHL